ncbi:MAG: hypothetical protein NW201_08350 [Gemmatimonadales bacterium]|nr:hypothetical protein [Gemmatimonadales bacterium]
MPDAAARPAPPEQQDRVELSGMVPGEKAPWEWELRPSPQRLRELVSGPPRERWTPPEAVSRREDRADPQEQDEAAAPDGASPAAAEAQGKPSREAAAERPVPAEVRPVQAPVTGDRYPKQHTEG